MKLPNGDRAFVDIAKLRDYSLNPDHEEGKHKARVFVAALGIDQSDAAWLRTLLLDVVNTHECQLGVKTIHGQRYVIDFHAEHEGRFAMLRSVWNIRPTEDFPRLVTCYVL